jgi:dTDP-glucose 4,6-dehydratase
LWEELRGGRLFITGGTGFFGKWLLETFVHANDQLGLNAEVVVLSRNERPFLRSMPHLRSAECLKFCRGDLRDFDFPEGEFSHVIHAAADASVELNEAAPLTMFDVIAKGTQRVLDFSRACDARRVLLVSSGAVYGRQPDGTPLVSEDYIGGPDPMSPAAAYAEGKRVAELLAGIAHRSHQTHITIARCFAFVGPHLPLDRHFAIGNFLRDVLAGGPLIVRGDGKSRRSYMYAADLVVWLWTILHCGEACRPYNVGSDCTVSVLEAAHAVAALPEQPAAVRVEGNTSGNLAASNYVPAIERARRELGLKIESDFQTALARTYAWLKQQGSDTSW